MPVIHPTASVSKESQIGEGVEIGPFCVLTGKVVLGAGVKLIGNVYLNGPIEIGAGTTVYPFACLGFPGQDVKFTPGMPTPGVKIGSNCLIRESATVHAATKPEHATTVGDNVFMMAYTHVGHDARLGNNIVMVNSAAVAGHVEVGDNVIISGGAVVHQFVRVGRLAFFSGGTAVSADVPPFCIVTARQIIGGINRVGMRRGGVPRDEITKVDHAFRTALRGGLMRQDMIERLTEQGRTSPAVAEMARFVAASKRAVCQATRRHSGSRGSVHEDVASE
jgi:UDP-N-acetylglucosamine acyltransferase